LAAFLWSASSSALVAQIDAFELVKNNTVLFADNFSNGLTPSQEPNIYAVGGSFPNGADAGGLLTMNTDWGVLVTNAIGEDRQVLEATALTGPSGLTQSDTIGVFAIFTLVTPPGPLTNGYGLQVRDVGPGPQVVAELDVQYNANFGGDVIRYHLNDFGAHTITTLGFDPFVIRPGSDEIALGIVRPDTGNNDFFGEYEFFMGGSPFGPVTQFSTPASLFVGTNFVLGRFQASTGIPEPATLALLGVGLAGLAAMRRRRAHI